MGLEEELYAIAISLKDLINILLILIVLVLVIIILRVVEKALSKKLELQKKDRNLFFQREIIKLKSIKKEPSKLLDSINSLARDFFKEAFALPYNLEYSELADEFKKTNKKECISFCNLISELTYSGEEVTEKNIKILINLLEKIIEKNKVLSKEEKLKLERERKKEKIKEKRIKKERQLFKKYTKFFDFVQKIFKNSTKILKKPEKETTENIER